jgi:hypothetical protein
MNPMNEQITDKNILNDTTEERIERTDYSHLELTFLKEPPFSFPDVYSYINSPFDNNDDTTAAEEEAYDVDGLSSTESVAEMQIPFGVFKSPEEMPVKNVRNRLNRQNIQDRSGDTNTETATETATESIVSAGQTEENFEMCMCKMQEYIFSNSPISLSPNSTDSEHSEDEKENTGLQLGSQCDDFRPNKSNGNYLYSAKHHMSASSIMNQPEYPTMTTANIRMLATPYSREKSISNAKKINQISSLPPPPPNTTERFISPKYRQNIAAPAPAPAQMMMGIQPTYAAGSRQTKSNAPIQQLRRRESKNVFAPKYIAAPRSMFSFQSASPLPASPSPSLPTYSSPSHEDSEMNRKIEDFEEHTENSDIESNTNSLPKPKKYKKLTYDDVEKTISKYYIHDKFSTEFDILITYIRGKKNLYIQSKNLIQIYLNMANIIIIILTAGVAVISPLLYNYEWSSYLITGINSIITLMFGLYNYLKLESTVDNFYKISNQYNNLETSIELTSNKLYFIKDDNEKTRIIIEKIEYLEEKLMDINDNFTMIIPELVKQIFPVISHINVFMFIKKIEAYKFKLIMDLCNIKNEIRYITYKYNFNQNLLIEMGIEEQYDRTEDVIGLASNLPSSPTPQLRPLLSSAKSMSVQNTDFVLRFCSANKSGKNINTQMIRIQKRLHFLLKMKKVIKDKIYHYKNSYGYIDEIFNEEIANAEHASYWFSMYFNCAKMPATLKQYKHNNQIMGEILKKTIYR